MITIQPFYVRRHLKVFDSSVNGEDRRYGYDAAWNLNYRTNNTTAYTFKVDGKNQLTNATLVGTQTYDNNGNATYAGGSFHGYAYDDENQLVNWYYYDGAKNGKGSPTSANDFRTEFIYDGKGRLRKRVEYTTDGSVWIVSSETRYMYDGMRVIQERNGSNVPQVSYTRGTDLSGSLEGAGGIGGLLGRSHAYQTGSGSFTNHNFYHADGNGNVTYMLNSAQSKVAEYRYDPFGNTISSSGTLSAANVYRFSSKEFHVNSGMYYYGYRFYDLNLQRWGNRDPLGELGFETFRRGRLRRTGDGPNLYMYAYNNPLNRFDPFGLDSPGCDGIPGCLESACRLECCASHDHCFDEWGCKAGSWLETEGECIACNLEALACFSNCLFSRKDDPKRPNYYCAVHHVYFNDPTSEHMNHSTD